MDLKTLEAVRTRLTIRVSTLVRESDQAREEGERLQSDRLWEQMRGCRQALEIVDSLIVECDGL